jgi:hypothetical protein
LIHSWTRYWTKPDGEISLADQGFLVPAGAENWLVPARTDLWRFEGIADRRCLILLGEPGMGKSQTLRGEADSVLEGSAEVSDLVLHVDLGATREESVLAREIFESAQFRTWASEDRELHVFLDSLDEAVLRVGIVGDIILKGLAEVDTSRLRLRLACRTADRLPQFESKLRALWPEDESGIYELAPLTREDVRTAAEDSEVDPDTFVQQLVERDIVALAIKPVTLKMLLGLARDPEGLPDSQLELYDRGLRHLVAEPGERRHRDRDTRGQLSLGQRLAVASRIAGATILTGRSVIRVPDGAEPSADLVTVAQLAGGTELDRGVVIPTTFEVSEDAVREVFGTGLFSARGDDLGWAHQTYGEYLAAVYLTSTQIPEAQVMTVLVADADEGRIVPQLRDVAGWGAAMDIQLADQLATHDPLVLLRGDVALADNERKARLAEALLQKRVAEELYKWDPRTRRNLAALRYEGLAAILRQRLTNPDEPQPVRELACELADLCEVRDLQGELLALALASYPPVRLRAAAVRALQTVADTETRQQLLPLASDPLPEDADDDLKGSTLRAVCPSVVSGVEALSFLTPEKNRNLTGAYAGFLSRDLPQALEDDELPAALEWVRRVPYAHDPMNELGNLAEQILVRGVDNVSRDDVRDPLVETVVDQLKNHHDLQSFRTRDKSEAFSVESNRHRLVEALVPPMRDGRLDPIAVITSTPRLVTGSDLPWLIERLHDAVGGEDETIWADLVDWGLSFEGADQDLVMEVREMSPVLQARTVRRFGPIELDSDLAARMRKQYLKEQEWAEDERRLTGEAPDFDANVDVLLDRFESGEVDAFWQLVIHIWGEEGRRHATVGGSDLTLSPGWRRAGEARRARIASAAQVYLRKYEPSDAWLDPAHRYHPATAGYCAVRYVAGHDPEDFAALGTATLCGWLPAILAFTHNDGEGEEATFRSWLLGLLDEQCPSALADAARKLILAEAAHGDGHLFVLHRLRPVLGGNLGSELLELWRTEELRPNPEAQLLEGLLRENIDGAAKAGLAVLTAQAVQSDADRSRLLAVALLGSGNRDTWGQLRPLVAESPEWGGAVFETLAHDWDRAGDFRGALVEDELADLFIWLSMRFPRDEDPDRLGTHFVGPREQVAEYRDQILSLIVEHATADALRALNRIEADTGLELTYVRIRAEEAWRINSWIPPRPEDVITLAADAQRRVVLSEVDLQRVVVESIGRIQAKLAGEGQAHQVWDTAARRPKRETEVAAWIADRLREDLRGRGIVINREVEVRVNPRGGIGERTDIHIDALAGERVEGAPQVTVVVEVKGCWHPDLMTALRSQLVEDYLSRNQRHGIYLPVWFGPTGWEDGADRRRAACARLNPGDIVTTLDRQAEALRSDGYTVAVVILDASLR